MFRKTLALDLEKKASRNVILKISIPNGVPIKLRNVPQFYSNDFLSLNHRNVKVSEYQEEKIKYHRLSHDSIFDHNAESDMLYTYQNNMKIIRDISLIAVNALFDKPVVAVIGSQAVIRILRYLTDTKADIRGCDSKINFIAFTHYLLQLNSIDLNQVKLDQMDTFKYLTQNVDTFDVLDVEANYRAPFMLVNPALRAMKENGLLVYTILQIVKTKWTYAQNTQSHLNINDQEPEEIVESTIRASIAKISQMAHLLGKKIEVQFVQINSNETGHLTLFLKISKSTQMETENEYRYQCKICRQVFADNKIDCNFGECEFNIVGPYYQGSLFNESFIDKCLEHNKFDNQEATGQLLNQAKQFINTSNPFSIIRFVNQPAYDFLEYCSLPQYETTISLWNNNAIYTNMPYIQLMKLVKSYVDQKGMQLKGKDERIIQIRSDYLNQLKSQKLIQKQLPKPANIQYPFTPLIVGLPRELRKDRMKQYGWGENKQ